MDNDRLTLTVEEAARLLEAHAPDRSGPASSPSSARP